MLRRGVSDFLLVVFGNAALPPAAGENILVMTQSNPSVARTQFFLKRSIPNFLMALRRPTTSVTNVSCITWHLCVKLQKNTQIYRMGHPNGSHGHTGASFYYTSCSINLIPEPIQTSLKTFVSFDPGAIVKVTFSVTPMKRRKPMFRVYVVSVLRNHWNNFYYNG